MLSETQQAIIVQVVKQSCINQSPHEHRNQSCCSICLTCIFNDFFYQKETVYILSDQKMENIFERIANNQEVRARRIIQSSATFRHRYYELILIFLAHHQKLFVKEIILDKIRIGDRLFASIIQKNWKNIVLILVEHNQLTSLKIILLTSKLPQIKAISLGSNRLNDDLQEQQSLASWPNLELLQLNNNHIGNAGLENLMNRHWPKLRKLNISFLELRYANLKCLSSKNFQQLKTLYLDGNFIARKGIKYVAHEKYNRLQTLSMQECMIDDQGLIEFSKSNWKTLSFLYLQKNRISNRGIKALLSNLYLTNLKYLKLELNLNTLLTLRHTAKVNWDFSFRCQYDFKVFDNDGKTYLQNRRQIQSQIYDGRHIRLNVDKNW